MSKITITWADDDGSAAPLYAMFTGQFQPQPAHLEFDPAADGLALSAAYVGYIGNGLPARVWNGEIAWFTVSPSVLRSAIDDLADDDKLADLLARYKAATAEDRGDLDHEIEEHLSNLKQALVYDASDWVEDAVIPSDAVKAGSIEAYAAQFDPALTAEPEQVVFGNVIEAVAQRLARPLERIYADRTDEQQQIARMLAAYNADEYGYLVTA